jgi:nucleoside-diphosphate-sugar epimerase
MEHKVSVIDNESVTPAEKPNGYTAYYKRDVRDDKALLDAIETEMPDVIYWLAAKQGYGNDYSLFGDVNIGSAYRLFDALQIRPVKQIILASSQAVYSPGRNVHEQWGTNPYSVYGITKLHQERAFVHFCQEMQINLARTGICAFLSRDADKPCVVKVFDNSGRGAEPTIDRKRVVKEFLSSMDCWWCSTGIWQWSTRA